MSANGANDDVAAEMQRIMGFGSFRSTKNTKVAGNEENWGVAVLGLFWGL